MASPFDTLLSNVKNKLTSAAGTLLRATPVGQLYNSVQTAAPKIQSLQPQIQSAPQNLAQRVISTPVLPFLPQVTPKSYVQGQIINPIQKGIEQVQKPGLLNKAIGAGSLIGGVMGATPQGALLNIGQGFIAGVGQSIREKQNPQKTIAKAINEPTSLATTGLGIQNPYIALGLDVMSPSLANKGVRFAQAKGLINVPGLSKIEGALADSKGFFDTIASSFESGVSGQDRRKVIIELAQEAKRHASLFDMSPKEIERAVMSSPEGWVKKLQEKSTMFLADRARATSYGVKTNLLNQKQVKTIENNAIKTHGTTENPQLGAFITSDGKMIDGSGRMQADPKDWKYMTDRITDHREIAQDAMPNFIEPTGGNGSEALIKYMNDTGNIRMNLSKYDKELNLDVSMMPTETQIKRIRQIAKGNKIIADVSDTKGYVKASGDFTNVDEWLKFVQKNIDKPKAEIPGSMGFASSKDNRPLAIKNPYNKSKGKAQFIQPVKKEQPVKLKIKPQEQKPTVAEIPQGVSQPTRIPSTRIARETIEQGAQRKVEYRLGENKGGQGSSLPDIISRQPIPVSEKVGLFDYIRTPDRVLRKIGLGKESDLIRKKYDDYVRELPIEIDKVTKWSKQVSPGSNQRIFKHLDGQSITLTPQEMKVAGEIRNYLSTWADRLKLPKEKRITNYITHIFDKELIQKEFDPELARLIENRVAGSVYDPFTEKRLGALGYKEDTWQALDAYVKRATRKVNMDVALEQVKAKAKGLEQSQYDYVKQYIDRINMRPTKLDNLLDNTIKQLVGYKFGVRPVASLARVGRQAVYRGTLGLNIGSAIRNLTQGANTYAKLGEKYTTVGYLKNMMKMAVGDDELERVGVLRDEFIQDRTLNATKKFWEKADKGLFSLFELAERINRGSAYFGAKAQALSKGLSEEQAIEYGKKIVRDTQFTFGSVDTPPILSSDIGKLLLQFQSYTLKQGEFLGEMIAKKDLAGMVRYSLAGLALTYSFGELFGMKPSDLIPSVRFGLPPTLQAPIEVGKAILGSPDKWGNVPDTKERIQNVGKSLIPFIPAGVQIKKTIEGLGDVNRGYSQTATGNVRYPVAQTPENKVRGALFGGYTLPEAQAYKKADVSPLSAKQSQVFKESEDKQGTYTEIIQKRQEYAQVQKAKEEMKSGSDTMTVGDKVLIKQKNGDIKTIDQSFQPTKPTLTGLQELDKKAISKYNSEITQKVNDIYDLFLAGKVSANDANSQISKLKGLSIKAGKKAPKPTFKMRKLPKLKALKAKKVKKIKAPKIKAIKIK